MNNINEKFESAIQSSPHFKVKEELNLRTLKAIRNASVEGEWNLSKSFNFLTYFIMNTKKFSVALAVLVLAVVGLVSYQRSSYEYHVNKAHKSVQKLQALLQGEASFSLIPTAYAQDGKGDYITYAEDKIAETSLQIVSSTEAAIEIVETAEGNTQFKIALADINDLQEISLDALSDAMEVLETEEAVDAVVAALETTVAEQEQVQEVLEEVTAAIEAGQETPVEFDVETTVDEALQDGKGELPQDEAGEDTEDSDASEEEAQEENEERMAEAELQLSQVREALGAMILSGEGEKHTAKLEAKLFKAEAALAEGKYGKVKGLTTAMRAKVRNEVRKAEKVKHKTDSTSAQATADMDEEGASDEEGENSENSEEDEDNENEEGNEDVEDDEDESDDEDEEDDEEGEEESEGADTKPAKAEKSNNKGSEVRDSKSYNKGPKNSDDNEDEGENEDEGDEDEEGDEDVEEAAEDDGSNRGNSGNKGNAGNKADKKK